MEKKYPIHINLLDEEAAAVIRQRHFLRWWVLALLLWIGAGTGIYFYVNYQLNKELSLNQVLLMQAAQIRPEIYFLSDSISFVDTLQKKDAQIFAITSQNPSKVKIVEDIEKVIPSGVQLNEAYFNEKIILAGSAENYSQMAQLMAGLQQYPYLYNVTLSAVNPDDNSRIEFKMELEWRGSKL